MMKSASFFQYTICALILGTASSIISTQDTRKPAHKQQIRAHLEDIPEFFNHHLEYTDTSFSFFLKRIYNNRIYPQHFLAVNFVHIFSGISLAPQAEQPRRFISKLLYLFDRKLQTVYINPFAFFELLQRLPAIMVPFCNKALEKTARIEEIKNCVGSYLHDHFKQLQEDPEKTIGSLAATLYKVTAPHDEKDITIEELQHSVHYFLGRALSNLVWSPSSQTDSWIIVKNIALVLEKCVEHSLIDDEMIDDLFWVLLQKYAFFIDLCATDFEPTFFDAIYKDLKTERAALWCAEEREELITTKMAFLQGCLLEAEIKARAQSLGPVGI